MKNYIILLAAITTILAIKVVQTYNHDPNCYTQGLQFLDSTHLIQSCGLYTQSHIRKLLFNQSSLQYQKQPDIFLPTNLFGEGITLFNDKIFVLTWRQRKVLVYDKNLKKEQQLTWKKEGWGITHNQTHMFISDGSNIIYVVDDNFTILDSINVTCNSKPVRSLNELQFYKGKILSNIYYQQYIAQIDPVTGSAILHDFKDIVSLQKTNNKRAEVLNGIAYDSINDKLLVTGKYWKYLYQVEL